MARLVFITHPEVVVDPRQPVPRWHLSEIGIARMRAFAHCDAARGIGRIVASTETKAIEAAGILAGAFGLSVEVDEGLGENDRSATGFLPPPEFEATADAFFAQPERSVRGWERAVDAQARVVAAMKRAIASHTAGDLALVAHGGVGTLLYCHLAGLGISRRHDQSSQGNYFTAEIETRRVIHGWREIAPRE
ncbi:histidine phosphatase family protein [Aureimonas psammosilenae]|uniref:histidine phosphatase family protein n=1 Tax=Aureimonas psammosilenae TaxID=2495496 RepID=UPI001260DF13|nr:histidine phosphatase family protein [Aureimonas psammosilenae]